LARNPVPIETEHVPDVRPYIRELPGAPDIGAIMRLLGERPHSFLLHSGRLMKGLGRWSFFGAVPAIVISTKGRKASFTDERRTWTTEGDPLREAQALLSRWRVPRQESEIPFHGGAVGWLGYDLRHFVETLPAKAKDDIGLPELHLAFYEDIVAADWANHKWYAISLRRPGESMKSVQSRLKALGRMHAANGATRAQPGIALTSCDLRSNFTRAEYLEAIRKAKRYIAAGDIYQVNLSQRFRTKSRMTPMEIFSALLKRSPAPFSCLITAGDKAVISSSPERFIRRTGDVIETRPIKGTRPRGSTPRHDIALSEELLKSEKDHAELAMIVDLERNDLGRVCRYGTVRVTEPCLLEKHPTVFHLVANVEGILNPGCQAMDIIRATFPGGSITGAPKIRSMEIIDELEPTSRGVYTGAIGWFGHDGDFDLSIAIRMLMKNGDDVYYQVGGGIVADSDPAAEYEETLTKGKAMAQALKE
jgi:para-aminobenzoate synthetase component 1